LRSRCSTLGAGQGHAELIGEGDGQGAVLGWEADPSSVGRHRQDEAPKDTTIAAHRKLELTL
jgi:hypothetical protein